MALTLDESWAQLPPPAVVAQELVDWGVFDRDLSRTAMNERWVRFSGVTFGVAPASCWP